MTDDALLGSVPRYAVTGTASTSYAGHAIRWHWTPMTGGGQTTDDYPIVIAEVTRGDPGAAHARYSVATSLLSYAEKLDDHPGGAILARTCRMLEAEYRGDVPLGTWAASPEPKIVWDHLFRSPPSR